MKTLTLRLDELDEIAIEHAKRITGEKTASKAIKAVLKDYPLKMRTLDNLEAALQDETGNTYAKLW